MGLANSIDWNSLGCDLTYQVQDGIEAQEILRSLPVDIVVTDIKMPGMDGNRFPHGTAPFL